MVRPAQQLVEDKARGDFVLGVAGGCRREPLVRRMLAEAVAGRLVQLKGDPLQGDIALVHCTGQFVLDQARILAGVGPAIPD